MSAPLQPLSQLVPGYGDDGPQLGDELLAADPDTLTPVQREMRRHMTLAVQSARELTFAGPQEVARRLELGHVVPNARKWVTLCIDERRRRIMVPSPYGGMQAQRLTTRKVPNGPRLLTELPLPDGGMYLLIYGGGPDILAVTDKHGGGVAADIAALRSHAPIADVVFWHLQPGKPATLFSLAVGHGECEGRVVEFPDTTWRDIAWPHPERAADSSDQPSAPSTPPGTVNPT